MAHLKTSFLESKSTISSLNSIFSCVSKYLSILCCWELFVEFTLFTGVCYYTICIMYVLLVCIMNQMNACFIVCDNKNQISQEHNSRSKFMDYSPLKTINITFLADGEFPGCDEQWTAITDSLQLRCVHYSENLD